MNKRELEEELKMTSSGRKFLEEAEPCEDAVSRAELLKIYEDRFVELQKIKNLKDNKGAKDRQLGVNYCINILKELPPVKPKRKKGKWVGTRQIGFGEFAECEVELVDGFVTDNCHCSGCGEELEKGERGIYCPNCGAYMESEEE